MKILNYHAKLIIQPFKNMNLPNSYGIINGSKLESHMHKSKFLFHVEYVMV